MVAYRPQLREEFCLTCVKFYVFIEFCEEHCFMQCDVMIQRYGVLQQLSQASEVREEKRLGTTVNLQCPIFCQMKYL